MKIDILCGVEGAKKSQGISVVVDIYRAASLEAYVLSKGVRYIIPVSTREEALNLKLQNPDYLLMGESNGVKIDGFDFGNSPSQIYSKNLKDKVLVHRSTQGTQGLVNALNVDELIFGCFPTVSAIASYIGNKNPDIVSIVAMAGEDSEDRVFAEYLKDLLLGKRKDPEFVKNYLRNHERSAKFLDPNLTQYPREDIDFCLDIDRFDFICLARRENKQLRIYRAYVKC